jgi:23S rRNA pseudouridine2605 synthase
VKLGGLVDEHALQRWRVGVSIGDRRPAKAVHVQHLRDEGGHSWVELVLAEGRNHQVHRMAEAIGQRVMRLARTEFAGLTAEGLRPGELRPCTTKELTQLQALAGKPARAPKPNGARRDQPRAAPPQRRTAPKRKSASKRKRTLARQGTAKRGTAVARKVAAKRKTAAKRRTGGRTPPRKGGRRTI